jgi:hypothetical protein
MPRRITTIGPPRTLVEGQRLDQPTFYGCTTAGNGGT